MSPRCAYPTKEHTTDRPLVFLIHGFLGHPEEFNPLVDSLKQAGYDTHCVCLPSHGDKPGDLALHEWKEFVHHCQIELERCQTDYTDIHLLGFSLGGAISILLAQQNPTTFQSLTLAATPYKSVFNLEFGQYHLKYFFNRFIPGTQYFYQRDTGHPKPKLTPYGLFRFFQQMDPFFLAVQQAIPSLALPTLLIHSPYDITIPYNHSEWLYDNIPHHTNFVTLLEGGHQIFPYQAKGVVEQAILHHLQQHPANRFEQSVEMT